MTVVVVVVVVVVVALRRKREQNKKHIEQSVKERQKVNRRGKLFSVCLSPLIVSIVCVLTECSMRTLLLSQMTEFHEKEVEELGVEHEKVADQLSEDKEKVCSFQLVDTQDPVCNHV